jgi:hypothetical protein
MTTQCGQLSLHHIRVNRQNSMCARVPDEVRKVPVAGSGSEDAGGSGHTEMLTANMLRLY